MNAWVTNIDKTGERGRGEAREHCVRLPYDSSVLNRQAGKS